MATKTFGIRMGERNYPRNHYIVIDGIADDAVLFEWLMADDYIATRDYGSVEFPAPEGYVFFCGELTPMSSLTKEQLDSLDDGGVVESIYGAERAYCHIGKANTMLESILKYVSPAEFYVLGISEDRVLDFEID